MRATTPLRDRLMGRMDRLQFLTPHKIANLLINKAEIAAQREHIRSRPSSIAVSIAGVCGSTCQLCPIGQGHRPERRGVMSLADFKRVVDPLKRELITVSLVGWGEPFANPAIYDMVAHLKAQRIRSVIYSNLQPLLPEDAQRVVESGLSRLDISLHGLTPTTYEAYQPGKHLGTVLTGLREIQRARERLGSQTPELSITFVVTRKNEHELSLLPAFAKALGVRYRVPTLSLNLRFLNLTKTLGSAGMSPAELDQAVRARLKEWLPTDRSRVNPMYERIEADPRAAEHLDKKLFRCHDPWAATYIAWDGNAHLCCGSFSEGEAVGNVLEEGFDAVWNGPSYQRARALTGSMAMEDDDFLCARCVGRLL